jgi:hypothetical protein
VKLPRWLIAALALCLLFCVVLAADLMPGLRGDYGWRWPYETPDWLRLLPLLFTLTLYLVGYSRIRRTPVLLIWCFLGALAIPLACLFTLGDPLYLLVTRTLSGLATGPHMAGAEIADTMQAMRDWPRLMPTYIQAGQHIMESMHVALAPPGLPLFYHSLDRLLDALPVIADPLGMALRQYQCQNFAIMAYSNAQLASAWFGVLMPVWAGLAVFPLYRLGGARAILWWPLVPSLAMFTPTWNTAYPLLAVLAFWLLDRGLQHISWRIVLSGILLSLATFANISIVPFAGFLVLYAGLVYLRRYLANPQPGTLTTAIVNGLLFLLGLISVWTLYYVLSGVTPLAILSQALGQHLELDRPYLPWIYLHLYDLALFTGFPLVIVALAAIIQNLRKRSISQLDPLGVSLILTLLILALSGTARGETGRVWLFFVPFILILATRWLDQLLPPRAITLVTITQAVMLITLVAFLRVMGTELNPPPDTPPGNQADMDLFPSAVTFADGIDLIGRRTEVRNGNIELTLAWRAEKRSSVPYYLSALLVKPDGAPFPQAINWQPFETRYPMTCWQQGQVITETKLLPLGDTVMPGNYWISLSMFDRRTPDKPVQVTQGGAVPDKQIGIGPVDVP